MSNTFEKQRDYLVQEIASAMDSVVANLDTLNRSLNESIQVGKEFENVGRLWSSFYDGELKNGQGDAQEVPQEQVTDPVESKEKASTP
ncbi:CIC11C00000000905 [Sungouiella intermedia]|uniref:DASH complex subunit DAD1 n=1 Tax=Sungouiella intermedia TaxID=45354 RepID=A0A1L0BQ86_9ASCO|nr:CIC11C00000000905 [[Candida] intermedia]